MARINIGDSHDRSMTKLRAELSHDSTVELNVGDSFDDSIRDIQILESDRTAIHDEVARLRSIVVDLEKRLPGDKNIPLVSRHAEEIASSAQHIIENRKWYSVSTEGLLEASKAVGSAASPLVSSAIKIIDLLNKLK